MRSAGKCQRCHRSLRCTPPRQPNATVRTAPSRVHPGILDDETVADRRSKHLAERTANMRECKLAWCSHGGFAHHTLAVHGRKDDHEETKAFSASSKGSSATAGHCDDDNSGTPAGRCDADARIHCTERRTPHRLIFCSGERCATVHYASTDFSSPRSSKSQECGNSIYAKK